MQVCFISYYAYRLFNETSRITFGGNEILYFLMAKELVKDKRFSVTFLLEDDLNSRPKTEIIKGVKLYKTSRDRGLVPGKNKILDLGVTIYGRLAERFNSLWQLPHKEFFRLGEKLISINADIYVQGSATYELGLLVFWCKLLRKKCVFLVGHDDDVNKTYVKTHKFGWLYEWGLKHCHLIWCTSKRHQQLLWKNYHRRATYIPYWFPQPRKVLPVKKRHQLTWIARLDPWKNPEAFLKLAQSLPRQQFLMIASLSEDHPDYWQTIVKRAKKIANLTLKTNVPFSRVLNYYQQARLFIDTSDYGSLHTSHLMAAASGTPTITLFKDPNNSFQEYGWGFTAKGNFNQFNKLVSRALTKPKLWQQLSGRALIFSQTVHNFDDQVDKFKQMLLNLATVSDKR